MKFIVSSSYLLKQLQVLGGIINNNNTLPILDNFLFDLDGSSLTVSASDLETTISSNLTVESSEKGIVCIPARLLLDTLKTFPEQPLTFTIEDNNTVEISSNHGKYALAYASGDEFPSAIELKDPTSTMLQGDILATAISKTIFASGNDDLRPVMSGVFFQFSTEGLTFVATDAHKLVKYTRTDVAASQSAEFIMPKKPLNLLKSILAGSEQEVTIEYNDSNAKFTFDQTVLICRLIDGKYPNYEAVIPKENPNKLSIDPQTTRNNPDLAWRTASQISVDAHKAGFFIGRRRHYGEPADLERTRCEIIVGSIVVLYGFHEFAGGHTSRKHDVHQTIIQLCSRGMITVAQVTAIM